MGNVISKYTRKMMYKNQIKLITIVLIFSSHVKAINRGIDATCRTVSGGDQSGLRIEGLPSDFQLDKTNGLTITFNDFDGCVISSGTSDQSQRNDNIFSLEQTRETNNGIIGTPVVQIPNLPIFEDYQGQTASFFTNPALIRSFSVEICNKLGYYNGQNSFSSNRNTGSAEKKVIFRTDKISCVTHLPKILNDDTIDESMAARLSNNNCFSKNKNPKKEIIVECSDPIETQNSNGIQVPNYNDTIYDDDYNYDNLATVIQSLIEDQRPEPVSPTPTLSSESSQINVSISKELHIINIGSPKCTNKIFTDKKGVCLSYTNSNDPKNDSTKIYGQQLSLVSCDQTPDRVSYLYSKGQKRGQFIYIIDGKKRCLDYDRNRKVLFIQKCDKTQHEFKLQKSGRNRFLSHDFAEEGDFLEIDVYNSSPVVGLLFDGE